MKIVHDVLLADDGVTVFATQHIDTDNPACVEMLEKCASDPAYRKAAGYDIPTSLSDYAGKTRWEVIQQHLNGG